MADAGEGRWPEGARGTSPGAAVPPSRPPTPEQLRRQAYVVHLSEGGRPEDFDPGSIPALAARYPEMQARREVERAARQVVEARRAARRRARDDLLRTILPIASKSFLLPVALMFFLLLMAILMALLTGGGWE